MELTDREFNALRRAAVELEDYRHTIDRMSGYINENLEALRQVGQTQPGSYWEGRFKGRIDAVNRFNQFLLESITERMEDGQ